jgi:hypothetical protein
LAAELEIVRAVHNSHAAFPQFLEDAVMEDGLADKNIRIGHEIAVL